jgi:hypothetical protein
VRSAGAADALYAELGLRCRDGAETVPQAALFHSLHPGIQARPSMLLLAHDRKPDGNRSPVAARDPARNSRRPCILENHGRCFLADHDRGRIGIATDDLRHD